MNEFNARMRAAAGPNAPDWVEAHAALKRADQLRPLTAPELEQLATCAFMLARDDEFVVTLERAHDVRLRQGDPQKAVRCAFWIGLRLMMLGQGAVAAGWLSRAQRLLDSIDPDCAERGWLLVPPAEAKLQGGAPAEAQAFAQESVALGERFRDEDLVAVALHQLGRALVAQGAVARGLALLDEAMLAVVSGRLSPLVTGLVYCSVIECCEELQAVGRMREWTAALSHWCEHQRGLVSFTGTCLVHRAEILRLQGDWKEALHEARQAGARPGPRPSGAAFYQQGEVHRLRGEFPAAESAYRAASQAGCEPQPGLALLRLAEGRAEAALISLRRVMEATTAPLARSRLLPALVEAAIAADARDVAGAACEELEEIRQRYPTEALAGHASEARGALELRWGEAARALEPLRRAFDCWQQLELPHAMARVRVLLGLACRALGDNEGAVLEFRAARSGFEALGAVPDLQRLDRLCGSATSPRLAPLTPRELQVLRLVAAGKTNKAIAAELRLSVKTVDRHLGNILDKLDVPGRAAATAYAYEHGLI